MDTHIYQMFSVAVSFLRILGARLFSRRVTTRWLGQPDVQFPAHIDCLQHSGRPRSLQCEPAIYNRWRMDTRHD